MVYEFFCLLSKFPATRTGYAPLPRLAVVCCPSQAQSNKAGWSCKAGNQSKPFFVIRLFRHVVTATAGTQGPPQRAVPRERGSNPQSEAL